MTVDHARDPCQTCTSRARDEGYVPGT